LTISKKGTSVSAPFNTELFCCCYYVLACLRLPTYRQQPPDNVKDRDSASQLVESIPSTPHRLPSLHSTVPHLHPTPFPLSKHTLNNPKRPLHGLSSPNPRKPSTPHNFPANSLHCFSVPLHRAETSSSRYQPDLSKPLPPRGREESSRKIRSLDFPGGSWRSYLVL